MRKTGWLVAAAVAFTLAGAQLCRAWNGTGHQVIALIAWNNLTPAARAKVIALLQAHPHYHSLLTKQDTPPENKDRDAFLLAATWPDLIRSPTSPGAKYNHPAWHYINYPFISGELPQGTEKPAEPVVAWAPGTDPVNAVQAYAKCDAELRDSKLNEEDRAVALAWIEHLVGDIHQPLHAVSWFSETFPKGDQGGNLIVVQTDQGVSNLHALWDGMLGNFQTDEEIEQLAKRVSDSHPRSEFAEELKVAEFAAWAKGSFEQARNDAYWEGKLPFLTREEQTKDKLRAVPALPGGYMVRAKADAERDVALAGYRLASLLNKVLGEK